MTPSPVEIEECVNIEEDYKKEKIEENEDKSVIYRDITDNQDKTNRDTFDNVIEERPDETSHVEMEEGVNDRKYDKNGEKMGKERQKIQQILKAPKLVKVNE